MQEYYKNWPEYVGLHLPVWYAPWSAYFSDTTDEFYYQMHKVKTIHMIDRKPWFCGSQGYKDLSGEYPVYAELCLHYIGMINFTIKELEKEIKDMTADPKQYDTIICNLKKEGYTFGSLYDLKKKE